MKKITFSAIFAVIFGIMNFNAKAQTYPVGDGLSFETAFEISTAEQLDSLRKSPHRIGGKYFKLVADIDLSSVANWVPIGTSTAAFESKLFGNGFKILNMTIDRENEDHIGLFGWTAGNYGSTEFNDVVIEGGSVKGKNLVGTLVGRGNALITNCQVKSVTVEGDSCVGGLVGRGGNNAGITGSSFEGSISGRTRVGGILGDQQNLVAASITAGAKIEGCISKATITATGNKVGGLAGYSVHTVVSNNAAFGSVSGTSEVGGLIGNAHNASVANQTMTISNNYSSATVQGSGGQVAGFIGRVSRTGGSYPIIVSNNFSKGDITSTASNTSAFIGHAQQNTTVSSNVVAATSVTAGTYSWYRLIGHPSVAGTAAPLYTDNYTLETLSFTPSEERPDDVANPTYASMDGTDKTALELQTQSTYEGIGWNFSGDGLWIMNTGDGKDGYAILKIAYQEPDTETNVPEKQIDNSFFAYIVDGKVTLNNKSDIQSATLVEVNGKLIYQNNNCNNQIYSIPVQLNKGMYIIRITDRQGSKITKIIY